MKSYIHTFHDVDNLKFFLANQINVSSGDVSSILVQIFSSQSDTKQIGNIVDVIEKVLPSAVIVGSTTVGEIAEGNVQLNSITISITLFYATSIKTITKSLLPGEEITAGEDLIQHICNSGDHIAGVLLLATPLNIILSDVFNGMGSQDIPFPIFGGGAGVYDSSVSSFVFCGNHYLYKGVIAVIFLSEDLKIYMNSHLGWQPLTKEMTVTESDGIQVKTVDHIDTFDLYSKYLNIKSKEDFFLNVLEFPFLLNRDGYTVARVPYLVDEKGSIKFVADVKQGEKIRIGYGDPELIIHHAKSIQNDLLDFHPETILIFACVCRRFLMQDDVKYEIQPFQSIAETAGFFTHGEFFGYKNKLHLLNSTTVVVGMREGNERPESDEEDKKRKLALKSSAKKESTDPFSEKHNQIVSRLFHFISVLSQELEEANKELTLLSEVDKLTQLCNRMKLDQVLAAELKKSKVYHTVFSVILMDIDRFKSVNDTHGHVTGDEFLIELSNLLKINVRKTDTIGRWGGEEFLLILPLADLDQACTVAEKLRSVISSHTFPEGKHLTCSFGVASYCEDDSQDTLIARSDKALYQAKNNGRDRVECME